jgi:hypothetical protein
MKRRDFDRGSNNVEEVTHFVRQQAHVDMEVQKASTRYVLCAC